MNAIDGYLDRAHRAGISSFRGKRRKAAELANSSRRITYDMPTVYSEWTPVSMVELANNPDIVWIRDEKPLELSAAQEENYNQQIDAAVNAIIAEGFTVQDHAWALWQMINHPNRHEFPRSGHVKAVKALQRLMIENGDAASFVCKLMDRKKKALEQERERRIQERIDQLPEPESSGGTNVPPEPEEITQSPGGVYDVYTGELVPDEEQLPAQIGVPA